MSELTYVQKKFQRIAASATPVLFSTEWKNSTGYLDDSTSISEFKTPDGIAVDIAPGERFTTLDDFGRRVVGIVVRRGRNLVIFERYAPDADGVRSDVLVHNTDRDVQRMLGLNDGPVDENGGLDLVSHFEMYNAFGRCETIIKTAAILAAE